MKDLVCSPYKKVKSACLRLRWLGEIVRKIACDRSEPNLENQVGPSIFNTNYTLQVYEVSATCIFNQKRLSSLIHPTMLEESLRSFQNKSSFSTYLGRNVSDSARRVDSSWPQPPKTSSCPKYKHAKKNVVGNFTQKIYGQRKILKTSEFAIQRCK